MTKGRDTAGMSTAKKSRRGKQTKTGGADSFIKENLTAMAISKVGTQGAMGSDRQSVNSRRSNVTVEDKIEQ